MALYSSDGEHRLESPDNCRFKQEHYSNHQDKGSRQGIYTLFADHANGLMRSFSRQFSFCCDKPPVLYECFDCHKQYKIKGSLQRHRAYECNKFPQQTCPYCFYVTKHKHDLKKHVLLRHKQPLF